MLILAFSWFTERNSHHMIQLSERLICDQTPFWERHFSGSYKPPPTPTPRNWNKKKPTDVPETLTRYSGSLIRIQLQTVTDKSTILMICRYTFPFVA